MTINWLVILNHIFQGVATGAGFMLVVILIFLYIDRCGKKKENKSVEKSNCEIQVETEPPIRIIWNKKD